jgi:hypothetical protein
MQERIIRNLLGQNDEQKRIIQTLRLQLKFLQHANEVDDHETTSVAPTSTRKSAMQLFEEAGFKKLGGAKIAAVPPAPPPRTAASKPRNKRSSPFAMPAIGEDDVVDIDAIIASERKVLEKIYSTMDGAKWRNKKGWLSDEHHETWHGVKVDNSSGQVVEIRLDNNMLRGQLPDEIGDLKCLRMLRVAENFVSGPIPAALARCTSLEQLWMSDNELTGSLPEALFRLPNVSHLHLSENQITGPISKIIASSTLQVFSIWGNQLTGPFPIDEILQMTSLSYIDIRMNPGLITAAEQGYAQAELAKRLPSHNILLS